MSGKKVLVTGGAGFIGRNMIRQMVADGYEITSLDNYKIGGKEFLPVDVAQQVNWVEGDSRDFGLLSELVRGKDGVIHLAAPSSFLMYEEDPIDGASVTTQGFLNVLEAMRRNDVRKLVYASTSAVYEGNPVPYVEGMTIDPPDLKALSKKWNEDAAHQYSTRYGIKAIGLRPFSVYGHDEFSKGGYANVISLFAWAAVSKTNPVVWGDGQQTRDFIYVDDAGLAFQRALEADLDTQEFNVGTGIETTFTEAIAMVEQELGVSLAPKFVDVPIAIYAHRLLADTTRAENVLGFRARTSVREGVRRVVEATKRAQRDWPELATAQMYFETLPQH
ncbi:NAD-dependent epimerase/dehydratase family protein [Saccharopolyspora indica]|uniref:NAD-dependent epimerase/dehydratase family protein n=1 Tax=Saccharopolyspora indica TaxID=1229659 RepID=UPI0022EAD677|nr:NAD-dependent epimerase/dehydratase family protein [Saccharopolyspora indica]MDA3643108.1 NAD-dependent epimerase/dehydratase family protein [Saccharopolyspora indica]